MSFSVTADCSNLTIASPFFYGGPITLRPLLRARLPISVGQAAASNCGLTYEASISHIQHHFAKKHFRFRMMESTESKHSATGSPQRNTESSTSPASNSEGYVFPEQRLKQTMDDASKCPLLLVACGSFSPITYLHLRMFEMAADYVRFSTDFEIVGGYLSPVSDAYKKAGLASAQHRLGSPYSSCECSFTH